MKIGLRVCVNTLQGALQGVPNLLRLFDEYKVQASFFFAMGPDRSRRLFGAHPLQPWRRQIGWLARLGGALQAPVIANRAAGVMRSVAEAGHETGLLSYDPVGWLDQAAYADEAWTRRQLVQAVEAYESVFHRQPRCHAAAAWQTNQHLLKLEQELGFDYATDVRGKTPFLPEMMGVESACPQLPTTLPLMAELLAGDKEVMIGNVHEYLYADSQYILPHGHVFSLDAEMEGMDCLPVMEKLVVMWKGYGEGLWPLTSMMEDVKRSELLRHQIGWSREGGDSCYVSRQSSRLM